MPKYKGPERRGLYDRRGVQTRRRGEKYVGYQEGMTSIGGTEVGNVGLIRPSTNTPSSSPLRSWRLGHYGEEMETANIGEQETVRLKKDPVYSDRRVKIVTGRRKGDLPRRLHMKAQDIILDISETPKSQFARVGKSLAKKDLLKKAAKKTGVLGLALGVAGFAKEASAEVRESKPKTTYKGEKSILPKTPKVN